MQGNKYKRIIKNFIDNLEVLNAYIDGLEGLLEHHHKELIPKTFEDSSLRPIFQAFEVMNGELPHDERIEALRRCDEEFSYGNIQYHPEKGEGKEISIYIRDHLVAKRFERATNEITIKMKQVPMIFSSSLINLAVYFELLATQLIQERLIKHPEAAQLNQKSLTFGRIEELGSLEEAKNFLIEQEVVDLMHQGFTKWLDYFEKNMKVDLSSIKGKIDEVNEIFCRRHLFVHNGGLVNNIYLTRIAKEYRKGIKQGDKLNVTLSYFSKAFKSIKEFGIILGLESWKRQEKKSEERVDFLLDYIYELLISKEWELAASICNFVLKESALKESGRWGARLNLWLTFKELEQFDSVKEEVEAADLSALSDEFQICRYALLEMYDEFFHLLEYSVPNPISLNDPEEWPMFKKVRELEEYEQFIKRKFPEGEFFEGKNINI